MRCHQHKVEFAWNEKCPVCEGKQPPVAAPPRKPKESDFGGLCRLLAESGYEAVAILPDQPEAVRAALGASLPVLYLTEHGLLSPEGLDPEGLQIAIVLYENDIPTIQRVQRLRAGHKNHDMIAINKAAKGGDGRIEIAPKGPPKQVVADMGKFWPKQWEHTGDNSADVTIATTYFNWTESQHAINKYFRWHPTLGNLKKKLDVREAYVKDVGLMFDAKWHRASDKIWCKESLLNLALTECETEYFAWIDNDIIICDNEWLPKAIEKLQHCSAVQLFGQVRFLDRDDNVIRYNKGAAWNWINNGKRHGSPGGAWIARRSTLLSVGGFPEYSPVGSTDQDFFNAIAGTCDYAHAEWCGEDYAKVAKGWMDYAWAASGQRGVDYLECDAAHIWHGDREHRRPRGNRADKARTSISGSS